MDAKRKLDDADGKVRELETSFKGYGTALKEINNNLQIVFLDSNRLSLEDAGNGEYQIKSRGKAVSLSQLSDGEKTLSLFLPSLLLYSKINKKTMNLIVICYLFLMILLVLLILSMKLGFLD